MPTGDTGYRSPSGARAVFGAVLEFPVCWVVGMRMGRGRGMGMGTGTGELELRACGLGSL